MLKLKFSGELWYWRGPAPFHFVKIPAAQSAKIKEISSGQPTDGEPSQYEPKSERLNSQHQFSPKMASISCP